MSKVMIFLNKSEEKVIERAELFKEIFENSATGESIVGLDGKWVEVNERLCKIIGYSRKELIGKSFLSITHPDDIEKSTKNTEDLVSGKLSFLGLQKRYIHKKGNIVWVSLYITVYKNGNNKPHYFIVHTQDITDIKKAEQELIKFKFIFEQSNQQIGLADMDCRIIDVNPSFAKNHGYTRDELIGKNFNILHPTEEKEKIQEDIKILMEKGMHSYEVLAKRKDGSTYPTLMDNFVLNTEDGPKYIVGMAVDISELRKSEIKNEQQKSLLDSIVSSSNDALLVIDLTGKVVFLNDNFKKFWKIPEELIKLKNDKKLLDFVVGQLANPKDFLDKVEYLYSHPEKEDTDRILFKDGRVFERYTIPQKIRDKIIGRIWNFRDITEWNEAEQEREKRIIQMEKINRLAVGRELKMVELKKEIEMLKNK